MLLLIFTEKYNNHDDDLLIHTITRILFIHVTFTPCNVYTGCTYIHIRRTYSEKKEKLQLCLGEFRVECKRNDLHKTYIILYIIYLSTHHLCVYNKQTFYPAGRCVHVYLHYLYSWLMDV